MSLSARVEAILSSPKPGAAPQVRTSPAFAERFRAEAARSGLSVDLEEKSTDEMVRLCPVCGAQNSRFVTACFNCQSDLEAAAPPRQHATKPRPADDTRWLNIARVAAPLTVRVPLARERFVPYAVQPVQQRQVLDRFLSVFIEREQAPHPPPKSIARFDDRSVLDKFLSVFIERQ